MCVIALLSFIFVMMTTTQAQTVPYLTFEGFILSNHSYIDISDVGADVECHTDLTTCCRSGDGNAAGAWYFPDGRRVSFDNKNIYMRREEQKVVLYKRGGIIATTFGIYQCQIPINSSASMEIIYAGIYNRIEGIIN